MIRVINIFLLTCLITGSASAQVINTIAGNDTAGYNGDGKTGINAQLYNASQLCLDRAGNLLIADEDNDRIRKMDLSTGIVTTIAGNGFGGYGGDNGPAVSASLWLPDAVRIDTFGNIYIADGMNARVRKITLSTGIITTIAGTGISGGSGDGGPATHAQLNNVIGVYVDAPGNVYIADASNNNIRKINAATGVINTIAGTGATGYSGDGGPATAAKVNVPFDMCMDTYGNLFFTDAENNVVRRIDATTGIITTVAGNGLTGWAGDGGPALSARMNEPTGIFIDPQNNIFVGEYRSGVIRRIDGATGIITTLAGDGIPGFSGDGGPATDAQLDAEGVCVGSDGTVYIADYNNSRIRTISGNVGVSVVNKSAFANVTLSPNPARAIVTVGNAAGTALVIYDAVGKDLHHAGIATDRQQIDIGNLPDGVYMVKCTNAQGASVTKQLVKAR